MEVGMAGRVSYLLIYRSLAECLTFDTVLFSFAISKGEILICVVYFKRLTGTVAHNSMMKLIPPLIYLLYSH